jgi:hypothetical protein
VIPTEMKMPIYEGSTAAGRLRRRINECTPSTPTNATASPDSNVSATSPPPPSLVAAGSYGGRSTIILTRNVREIFLYEKLSDKYKILINK